MKVTHPDLAALITPLYALRKEKDEIFINDYLCSQDYDLFHPLSAAGEERGATQSAGGVSQIVAMLKIPLS